MRTSDMIYMCRWLLQCRRQIRWTEEEAEDTINRTVERRLWVYVYKVLEENEPLWVCPSHAILRAFFTMCSCVLTGITISALYFPSRKYFYFSLKIFFSRLPFFFFLSSFLLLFILSQLLWKLSHKLSYTVYYILVHIASWWQSKIRWTILCKLITKITSRVSTGEFLLFIFCFFIPLFTINLKHNKCTNKKSLFIKKNLPRYYSNNIKS